MPRCAGATVVKDIVTDLAAFPLLDTPAELVCSKLYCGQVSTGSGQRPHRLTNPGIDVACDVPLAANG